MNLVKISLLIFFLFFSIQLNSQVIITGIASSYAGDELKLCKISDRITYKPEILATSTVDSSGNFKFEFKALATEQVYIDLPTLKAYIFVEPNKQYDVRIPRKFEMTDEQFLDPFFSKDYIPARITKAPENDINLLIIKYNSFLNKNKNQLLKITHDKEKKAFIDSIKITSDTLLNSIDNEYFEYFKKTDFALMKYYHIQNKKNKLLDSIFTKMPVLFNSSSYMSLFNMVFDNPFKTGNSILSLNSVYSGLKNNNFGSIRDSLMATFPTISTIFAELLVAKGLYGKFYEMPQTQNDIVSTLQKVDKTTVDSNINVIITNELEEFTTFRQGMHVPEIILPNKKNKLINITKFEGEFVYLQFFHPKSFACIQQMTLLENYYNLKIKKLNIITVFVGDDIQQMKDYQTKNKKYKWTFLFSSKDNELLKKYKVDIYPTYVLIDPDGNLSLQQTPSPTENFEATYNQEFKKFFGN